MSNGIPENCKKAVKSALNILDYADNTEKKLREKLARKGYGGQEINFAVAYAKKAGYLNEKRHLAHAADIIATGKLYGKRRMITELYAKGFRREDIEELDLSEINFAENCAKRIQKTKNNYADRDRLNAALLRYGYSWTDIRRAYEIIEEEYEENE